uniref:Interferon-induced, double-stranded RNA-activated protein kinase-like n=1 Tax=Cyprinodon variegatus TaxID=28743 RepID=A0A3Q2D113_CYPVA
MDSANYVARLNEYAQKERLLLKYEEVGSVGPDHIKTFSLKAVVNGKAYPEGVGKNKKEAKQNAAKNALQCLLEEPSRGSIEEAPPAHMQLKTNYMCWLNEYGQTNRVVIRAVESITPGQNTLTQGCRFVVGDKEYPVAYGRTKKDAREEAARLVHHEIMGGETLDSGKNAGNSCISWGFVLYNRFTADYDSIERLDKGSFGRVFKAKHKLEDKYYAVKIVHYREKTLQEVKVLSDLNHCNIVRYHSCWLEDGTYQWDTSTGSSSASQSSTDQPSKFLYIQMELCEIKTLRVWIDEKNIQNHKKSLRDFKRREESLNFALQMISGVEHIHSRKLIHRDLKPANIMFSRNGTVKIGDFGLVTSEIEDDAENQKERRGYKGTPSYMAPEQRNRKLYDRKVDIFALGLIFFELLWNIPTLNDKNEVRFFFFSFLYQMINSMLCSNPEERPEASKIKINLEEHIHSLAELKTKQRDSKTI